MILLYALLLFRCSSLTMGYFPTQQIVSGLIPSLSFKSEFTQNGTKVITMWSTGLHVWQRATDSPNYFIKQIINYSPTPGFVCSKFSPSSDRIIIGGDRFLKVWKYNPVNQLYEVNQTLALPIVGFTGVFYDIAFSGDGNRLMASCNDTFIYVWLLDSNTNYYIYGYRLAGHTSLVYGLVRRGVTQYLASSSTDNNINIWKWDGSSYTIQQTVPTGGMPTKIELSRDGLMLISGQSQRTVMVWKRPTLDDNFTLSQTLLGHQRLVNYVKLNNNDTMLGTSSVDCTKIWLYNSTSGKFETYQTMKRIQISLDFNSFGEMIAQEIFDFQPDRANFYKIDIDCSTIEYSDGKDVVNGLCSCRDNYAWQSNSCVIDCSKIPFTSGRIDSKTCGCINEMIWNGGFCIDKPPTALIAGIVTGVSVLLMGAFLITRYYRYKAILAETAEAQEAQLHDIQMTNDQLKQDPVCPVTEACSVCLEDQTDVVSSCRHMFHKNCLLQWVSRMESCPNCRNPDFTVVIQCHKCLAYLMPRAFCKASCKHKTTVMCLRSQVHNLCIECRFVREQGQDQ